MEEGNVERFLFVLATTLVAFRAMEEAGIYSTSAVVLPRCNGKVKRCTTQQPDQCQRARVSRPIAVP